MDNCVYLGQDTGRKDNGHAIHECPMHQHCIPDDGDMVVEPIALCKSCKNRLTFEDNLIEFQDQLHVTDRDKKRTHILRNLLSGGSAFLVCGGPSAADQPLHLLQQRGLWSLAVNNVAALSNFKPNAFVCSDPPQKFHNGIWQDPSIMKFVPHQKLSGNRSKLREKVKNEFKELKITTRDCPNVWGFAKRGWLEIDETFFTDTQASLGNLNVGVRRTGERKTACTMLIGIRLLYYLGARKIFLLGCDFKMVKEKGYAFREYRSEEAVMSNNIQLGVANDWLCRLEQKGIFRKFGLQIYNCFQSSHLKAFPFLSFYDAHKMALQNFPAQPFDTIDWYQK